MSKITIFFVLIMAGGLMATLIVDGVWAFYIYQLVYFLNPKHRWWGSTLPDISYSFVLVIFMMIGLMIRYNKIKDLAKLSETPLTKWVVGILIMFCLTYFVAIDPDFHKQSLIEYTKLIIIVGIAYKLINSPKKLEYALWFYVLGATYIGYLATTTGRNAGDRLEGIGTIDATDSNGTAAIIVPALILLLYFVWQSKSKYVKGIAIVCGALIANGVVLINSRGSFLATVIGATYFVTYMLFSKYQRPNQRIFAILLVVGGLSGVVYVTDTTFWERMASLEQVRDDEGDRGGAHRIDFWLASFDIMADYPFGVGIRGYNWVSANYLDPSLTKGGTAKKSVHSTWFQGLTELGWPGPILFFGLLFSCYRLSKKTKAYLIGKGDFAAYFKLIAIEGALLSYLIASTFINNFRAEILYWLILFVGCAVNVYWLQALKKDVNQNNHSESKIGNMSTRRELND